MPLGGRSGALEDRGPLSSAFSFTAVSAVFFERGLTELRIGATMTGSVFRLVDLLLLTVLVGLISEVSAIVSADVVDVPTWTLDGRRTISLSEEGTASGSGFWL